MGTWCGTEPAPLRIKLGFEQGEGPVEGLLHTRFTVDAWRLGDRELPDELARAAEQLFPALVPRACHALENLAERRAAKAPLGGKYVPPKNGSRSGVRKTDIGQPPNRSSPVPRPCRPRRGRALLAVDLDGHEVGVEERRDVGVTERLALHDVAPVARRVANR